MREIATSGNIKFYRNSTRNVCSEKIAVNRVLTDCIPCRFFNGRTIKLSQNDYRDFRISPESVPYKTIFADFLGHFYKLYQGEKTKA